MFVFALGSVRTEVVRFFGCGGLATFLAPGRGTYGSVWSAAFQGCKDRRKILKWRHMRAFSGSVSEWCGRADAARMLPQQPPSDRAASARTQAAAAPAAAWRPGSIRLAAGQHPLGGRAASASRPNGCCPAGRMLRRLLPRQNGCCLPPAAHGARSLFGEAAALEPLEPTAPVPTHPVGSQPRSRTVSARFGRSQELPVASSGALRRRRVPG